jgi:hypothetical protein
MAVPLLSEPLRGFDHTPISIHQPSDGVNRHHPLSARTDVRAVFYAQPAPSKKHAAVHGEKSAARPLSKKSCGSAWRKICRPACVSKNHAAVHGKNPPPAPQKITRQCAAKKSAARPARTVFLCRKKRKRLARADFTKDLQKLLTAGCILPYNRNRYATETRPVLRRRMGGEARMLKAKEEYDVQHQHQQQA